MMRTMIVVDSESEAHRINRLYPCGEIVAVPILGSVPSIRVERLIINRAVQTSEWRDAIGGDRYDRWEREVLMHRLDRPRDGLILL